MKSNLSDIRQGSGTTILKFVNIWTRGSETYFDWQKHRYIQLVWILSIHLSLRDAVKNVLADFFRYGGTPPPSPLTENHFAKKPLAELGGTPQPPLTENFPHKMGQKGLT